MINIAETASKEMRAILKDIKRLDPELRKVVQRKFRDSSRKVAAIIQAKMPRRTGEMARKVKATARSGKAEIWGRAPHTRIVERGAEHPVFGKAGTQVMQPAQPSIFPTVKEHSKDYFNEANRALNETLRELKFR